MANYDLSEEAEADLDRLYEHGILNFGLRQANQYYDGLISRFDEIAQNPFLYRAVGHIRAGYRLSVYGVNSIYYRIQADRSVFIVRILGRQNPDTEL
jgi:toxin ParE1/3/4